MTPTKLRNPTITIIKGGNLEKKSFVTNNLCRSTPFNTSFFSPFPEKKLIYIYSLTNYFLSNDYHRRR